MGVTGLWKLIEPCGKPVPVETLEGKVLAVDISIWLHQVVKGFQDNKGAALNNAHLLGLFHRLCKLMFYRVKPVFVFDGCVPQLKRDTIARRQQQRNKLSNEADRIQNLLLQSLAKEKVVQMALGPNAELLLTSPVKKKVQNKDDAVDDMFKLPELPESSKKSIKSGNDDSMEDSFEDSFCSTEDYTTTSASDSSNEESNPRNAYSSNLQAIDVRSNDFKQLPADVRHDILVDIKETRKQSSWGRLHELPSHSDDFSTFQMKRLLKRRQVQVSLEEAEKEMGNDNALTYTELTNIFTEEGILESETLKKGTKQISSSESTRYLLVRDLKKKFKTIEEEIMDTKQESQTKLPRQKDELPSTSKCLDVPDEKVTKNDTLGNEYDADLELAIALSLQDTTDQVYNENDYDYDSDETIKLNKNQRRHLQNAAKGPAAAYMIEYAGMNKEEVDGIMEKTQVADTEFDDSLNIEQLILDAESNQILKPHKDEPRSKVAKSESQEMCLRFSDDSDNTDSDLEEVEEENSTPVISITVELDKIPPSEDDLFADVFKEDECVIQETPEFTEMHSNQKDELHKRINDELEQKNIINVNANVLEREDKNQLHEKQEDECIIEETPPVIQKEESKNFSIKTNKSAEYKSSSKSSEMLLILDELKKQVRDVKNINLDNIKFQNSVVEISDDELLNEKIIKGEIIEICDSDDGKRPSTPPADVQLQQSPKNSSKSPKLKTPSKNHSITEFFNVNYVVKRTPDKPQPDEDENSPKVQTPFFVKKTPRSACKSGSNSPATVNKISKASKTLFDQSNKDSQKSNAEAVDDGIEALPVQETASEEDVIKEAAELLKSQKTTCELSNIAANLAKDRRDLETERNRQDRLGMSITQRMNSDCQELLRLFGVPFIVAPMEAEAQCAFLDIVQLTNGTITDDSDIWLFGGRTVYKNFFAQNKHVMEFRSEQIEKNFNCDRKKLIQLACLVGSDYTTGIHGIGAVTALEILASFTPKDNSPETCNLSAIQNILSTLQRFRGWWQSMKTGATPPGSSTRHALQKKLKNIEMLEGFPNIAVVEAYLAPKIDDNKEAMSWGYPDVESLREFAKKSFGWTNSKTDDILMPVIKKLNEKTTQQSIRNYFNVKSSLSSRQVKVSKRVKNAIDRMTGNVDSDDTPEKPTKAKRSRQIAKTITKKKKNEIYEPQTNVEDNLTNKVSLTIEAGSSSQVARGPIKRASKRTNIQSAKEIIPQREKSIEQMEANKALAAEILRNTSKDVNRKRNA